MKKVLSILALAAVLFMPTNLQNIQAAGKIYYVSKDGASRGADGLSPATAKKDIQAVLNLIKENGDNGAIVRIGEGRRSRRPAFRRRRSGPEP